MTCVCVCDHTGCQVCGGKKEAPAVLPAHGDEQAHPDTARVHCLSYQGNTATAAAFLPVSAHVHTHTCPQHTHAVPGRKYVKSKARFSGFGCTLNTFGFNIKR